MRPTHLLQLLFLAFIWGTAYLFMRSSVPAFGPAPMIFLRMSIGAALVLLPLALIRHGPGPLLRDWRLLAWFGVAFTAVPFLGLGYAAKSISAGLLAVLQSAAPLFAAIVAHFWLREHMSGSRVVGLLIGFAGVGVLVWDKVSLTSDAGIAIIVSLAATAVWGYSSNYARVRLKHVEPVVLAAGSLAATGLALAPLAIGTWPEQMPGPRAWAEVMFLGIASSGLGFVMYFRLLRTIGAVRTTSVTFLNPIVAMASAAIYLGEPVTLQMVVGCAIILLGTALVLGLLPLRRKKA